MGWRNKGKFSIHVKAQISNGETIDADLTIQLLNQNMAMSHSIPGEKIHWGLLVGIEA